ncbi:unnamed protein product [Candida verbasci]|uniref:Uncharacterized protein n=1 Tax=Candida verbasci TaxID=1227364 RepID=A0A9W4TR93_9ASCO|nr:unnamed protein product [Candida verbasci]
MTAKTNTSNSDFSFTLWDNCLSDYSYESEDEGDNANLVKKSEPEKQDKHVANSVNQVANSNNQVANSFNLFVLTKINYFKRKSKNKSKVHKVVKVASAQKVKGVIQAAKIEKPTTLNWKDTLDWTKRRGFPNENLTNFVESISMGSEYTKTRTNDGWFVIKGIRKD